MSNFDMHSHREKMCKDSKKKFEAIFTLAGYTVTRVWELANGYWPLAPEYDEVREPWWLFETDKGLIQIGWRKRVIHIEWYHISKIVTTDDVTKGERNVHAYSVEKAIEYLKELRA